MKRYFQPNRRAAAGLLLEAWLCHSSIDLRRACATRRLDITIMNASGFVFVVALFFSLTRDAAGQINREALRNQKLIDAGKYRKFEVMNLNLRNQKKKIKEKQNKAALLNLQYSMNGTRFCEKSFPFPNDFLSVTAFTSYVIPISDAEKKGSLKCSFLGAVCPTEATEHTLVDRFLNPDDTVLEVKCSMHDDALVTTLARLFNYLFLYIRLVQGSVPRHVQ